MSKESESTPSRSQLRQEAVEWFTLMRGADASAHREAFNAWLARGALHRSAYNSVAEVFTVSKILKTDKQEETSPLSAEPPQKRKFLPGALALSVALVAVAIAWHQLEWQGSHPGAVLTQVAGGQDVEVRYATSLGEIRNFGLQDGSNVTLDTNGLILASFTPEERGFRLMKGRARFFSAKNGKPFVVHADTTVIHAQGAVFDVALLADRNVRVRTIAGDVAVRSQSGSPRSDDSAANLTAVTTRMGSGERLAIDAGTPAAAPDVAITDENWPHGIEAFDNVSVATLVAEANRYAAKPILIGDSTVASLKISGTYHLQDTQRVAEQIADLLSLSITYKPNGFLLSERCPKENSATCRPPS